MNLPAWGDGGDDGEPWHGGARHSTEEGAWSEPEESTIKRTLQKKSTCEVDMAWLEATSASQGR